VSLYHCLSLLFYVFKATVNRRTLGEALGEAWPGGGEVSSKKKITAIVSSFKDLAEY